MNGEIVIVFLSEIQEIFVQCDFQIFPVLGRNIIRIDKLYEDHELVELAFLL